jgi:hypothetical protein
VYINTCGHPTLFELRACLTSLCHRLWEGRRSLDVVEAATLRPLGSGRQAESRKIRLDHLKMKLGIRPNYKNRYSPSSKDSGSTKYKKIKK